MQGGTTQPSLPSAVASVPVCIVSVILLTPFTDRRLSSSEFPMYLHMNYVKRDFRNRPTNGSLRAFQENQL